MSNDATVTGTGGNFGGGSAATSGEGLAGGRLAIGGAGVGSPDASVVGDGWNDPGRGMAEGGSCAGAGREAPKLGGLLSVGVCITVFCGNGGGGSLVGRDGGSGVEGSGVGCAEVDVSGACSPGGIAGGGGTGPGVGVPPFASTLLRVPVRLAVSCCRSATVVAISGGAGTLARLG